MTRPLFSPFVVILSAALFWGCGGGDQTPDSKGPSNLTAVESGSMIDVDRPIPDFTRPTLTGDTLRAEDLKGQVTLVNFWATWCGPCIIETPELIGLREEWKERSFEVVGVSMDLGGFDAVRPFAEEFGITYPIILDEGPLADHFGGVYGLPTTFVVNPEGTIIHRYMGIFPVDDMRSKLDGMLQQTD